MGQGTFKNRASRLDAVPAFIYFKTDIYFCKKSVYQTGLNVEGKNVGQRQMRGTIRGTIRLNEKHNLCIGNVPTLENKDAEGLENHVYYECLASFLTSVLLCKSSEKVGFPTCLSSGMHQKL